MTLKLVHCVVPSLPSLFVDVLHGCVALDMELVQKRYEDIQMIKIGICAQGPPHGNINIWQGELTENLLSN